MDWMKIETSLDNTHYLYEGRRLFGKNFIEVLNFHTPGIAAVLDASGIISMLRARRYMPIVTVAFLAITALGLLW